MPRSRPTGRSSGLPFLRLMAALAWRHAVRHKLLSLLNLAGIALGAAVFVAIQVANQSALGAFRASVDLVAGRAHLELAGDGVRFSESLMRELWRQRGIAAATPAVEQIAAVAGHRGEYLRILGVDLFSNGPFRTWRTETLQSRESHPMDFFNDPRAIAITETVAARLGVHLGDEIQLLARGRPEHFRVLLLLRFPPDAVGADEHMAIMDIANAQEAFDCVGRLDRAQVLVTPGVAIEAVRTALQARLPAGVQVRRPGGRSRDVETMIDAFQLNLSALSLISLLVGMFLIHNTVAASVVRRRSEIGVLRALGCTRLQIRALFLGEAFVIGLAGAAGGIVLGRLLASFLIDAMSRTISSLYVLVSIRDIVLTPQTAATAVVLGAGTALAAAWFPAREASCVSPVDALAPGTLHEKAFRGTRRLAAGAAACLLGAALCGLGCRTLGPPWLGFGAALFALLGFTFLVPATSQACADALLKITPARCAMVRLALANFARSLHRNSLATSALVAALAMMLGLSIMIHSFRATVGHWLTRSITADLFVAPASNEISPGLEPLPADVEALLRRLPAALAINGFREIHVPFRDRLIAIAATDLDVTLRHQPLPVKDRDPAAAIDDARRGGKVLVNEAFSRRFGLGSKDRIPLTTPGGRHEFEIAGVFTDYSANEGLVLMDRRLYQSLWNDATLNTAAIYLRPGEKPGAVRDRLRRDLSPHGEYLVYSNADLRRRVFAIFDQTFALTTVLRFIALAVAGLGIFLSLTILVTEREREIGLLRAAGATRAQVRRTIHVESLLIGLVGTALGTAAGFALAAILSWGINVAFFGWTIDWATPWPVVLETPLWVLPACVAAALLPAIRAGRLPPAQAVRAE